MSPLTVRHFLSQSRITLYSLGKSFRMWIMKSSSDIVPFSLNSFIQNCSPSKSTHQGLSSLTPTYYCGIHFLTLVGTRLYVEHTLPVPYNLAVSLRKICTLGILTKPNATFPTEELVLIEKIKSYTKGHSTHLIS